MLRLSTSGIRTSAREPWFSLSASAPRTTPPTGLGHGLNWLWLAALGVGFCLPAEEFVEGPALHLRIEHFQGSAAGVDLIVMREIGEAFENAEQLLVP